MRPFSLAVVWCLTFGVAWASGPRADDYVQDGIKDFTLNARAAKANERELIKISKDFAMAYRALSSVALVRFKEPSKFRIESTIKKTKVLHIVNGNRRMHKIAGVKLEEDIRDAPGKRQTSLDFGFISPSLLKLGDARFVREDRNGNYVFDFTWKKVGSEQDTSRHRLWIDPKTKIIERREWYNQEGRMMATFHYKEPVRITGDVFLPTVVQVYNVENKFAGETRQSDFKVNTGLEDSLFTW